MVCCRLLVDGATPPHMQLWNPQMPVNDDDDHDTVTVNR